MQTIQSPLDVIKTVLPGLGSRLILDIGCGWGDLVRQLLEEGAVASGVDPGEAAVAEARRKVPEAEFQVAGAEALPFGDESFDLAVMVYALHHVPLPLMRQALREGLRVVKGGGCFVVIEPLASGSFFEAVRVVDDETEVRNAAQSAIRDAVAAGDVKLLRTLNYSRQESFAGASELLERIVAVDPSRRELAERNRDRLKEILHTVGIERGGRFILDQPARADILAKPARD